MSSLLQKRPILRRPTRLVPNLQTFGTVKDAYDALPSLSPGDAVRVAWAADAFVSAGATYSIVDEEGQFVRGLLDCPGGVPIYKIGATISERGGTVLFNGVTAEGYPQHDNTADAGEHSAILDIEFESFSLLETYMFAAVPNLAVSPAGSVCGQEILSGPTLNRRNTFMTNRSSNSPEISYFVTGGGFGGIGISPATDSYLDNRLVAFLAEVTQTQEAAPTMLQGIQSIGPPLPPQLISGTGSWRVSTEGDWLVGAPTRTGLYVNDAAEAGAGTFTFVALRARARNLTFL